MGLSQGDVIQIVDAQTYLGVDLLNVYYYRYFIVAPAVDPVYDTIKDWFVANVIAAVRQIQLSSLTHVSLEIRNLTNGVDVKAYAVNQNGLIAYSGATGTPSWLTAGFIMRRETAVTRNGYKRISGLSDAYIDGNVFVFPTGAQAAIEAAMVDEIPLGLVDSLEPVIYRDATLTNPAVVNSIGQVQYVGLGTQNTRKR